MKKLTTNLRRAFALILIAVGVLMLLQNTGIAAGDTGQIVSVVLLAALGTFFTAMYFPAKRQWFWVALGLGCFSFALGSAAYFFPAIGEDYKLTIIFFGVGISFLSIYLKDRINWWAMFPAGLLLSLGVSQLTEKLLPEFDTNGILLLGLGVSFMVLFLVPTPLGRLKFALAPAILLLALGALILVGQPYDISGYLLPGAILLAGVVLIVLTTRKR